MPVRETHADQLFQAVAIGELITAISATDDEHNALAASD
jgi:hypothetical protein